MKKLLFAVTILMLAFNSKTYAQVYTDEVQVISGLGGKVGIGLNQPVARLHVEGKDTGLKGRGFSVALKLHSTAYAESIIGYGFIEHDAYGDVLLGATRSDDPINLGYLRLYAAGTEKMVIRGNGNVGIGIALPSQMLSVNGNASKATAGDWLANSDARLKTNITPLNANQTLQKLLQLQGVTYEWNDDKTGLNRPKGIQFGFTAQNIRVVYPSLVVEDNLGYLQSSYSTYDAMLVESIRALNEKIEKLERENGELKLAIKSLRSTDDELKASIQAILWQLQGYNPTSTPQAEKK